MAVDTRSVAARDRWERVDQLRGLAALAVVVCHLAVSADRGAPNLDGVWPCLALVLGFGYLGVPLFFVISGFCIHLPQARALSQGDPLAATPEWTPFFARRFWRLYPPYLAALGVALALWWAAGSPIPWLAVTTQALLVHAFHTATFDGVNPPAWTLAVEAQLYLAYPIVFWLIARIGALRALAAVFGVTMAYRVGLALAPPLPAELGGPAWELFLARWFEWVLGAVVAEWTAGRLALPRMLSTPSPGAVALAAGVLIEWYAQSYGLYILKEPFYGVAFALILCTALARERPGLGSAPGRYLAGVGVYSYSLYLLHRPIQLAFEPLARELATWPSVAAHGVPSSLLIMAATTPVVLWAARIFYHCCERPSIRRSRAP